MIFQRSNNGPGGVLQTREVWDSVALTYTVFNGAGAQVSQRALTAPEAADVTARAAAATVEANAATIRAKTAAALTANQTFLALGATPTAAQVRDQTIRLTRQMDGLLRLTANLLADVSDT